MKKIIIVGARRSRQGIGEFLANAFVTAGAEIVAVIGTTPETAALAQANLFKQYGIKCAAYDSLGVALEKEPADIVAICTPFEAHLQQLELVLAAGIHCLCEKPMVWGMGSKNIAETRQIVDGFIDKNLYLSLVTQWPHTLLSFYELFPREKNKTVATFEMALSPIRPGPDMVLDAAPHLLSMLFELVGHGEIQAPASSFSNDKHELTMSFKYKHKTGITAVNFRAAVCEQIPRPASYCINGHTVSREIELPDYSIWFQGNAQRIPVTDPLNLLAAEYLNKINNKTPADRESLVASIEALGILYKSAMNS